MSTQFAELVQTLTPAEEEAVRTFIEHLRSRSAPAQPKSLLAAAEEFMNEHPDILRRLAS